MPPNYGLLEQCLVPVGNIIFNVICKNHAEFIVF